MSYFQVLDFPTGEHHVFQYWHHVAHFIKERERLGECNVILIECVRGDYHRALLEELKNYKEELKNG